MITADNRRTYWWHHLGHSFTISLVITVLASSNLTSRECGNKAYHSDSGTSNNISENFGFQGPISLRNARLRSRRHVATVPYPLESRLTFGVSDPEPSIYILAANIRFFFMQISISTYKLQFYSKSRFINSRPSLIRYRKTYTRFVSLHTTSHFFFLFVP